jgi:hypothetical protein
MAIISKKLSIKKIPNANSECFELANLMSLIGMGSLDDGIFELRNPDDALLVVDVKLIHSEK